jgi:acetylglutamate kinase
VSQAEAWIRDGVIVGGIIPKMNYTLDALHSGVEKVHILDGCLQHSILLELFTDLGVGTQLILDEDD